MDRRDAEHLGHKADDHDRRPASRSGVDEPLRRSTISRVAGPTLGVGDIRLTGTAANGQRYMVAPKTVWAVAASPRGARRGRPRSDRAADAAGPARRLQAAAAGHRRDRLRPFRELRRRPASAADAPSRSADPALVRQAESSDGAAGRRHPARSPSRAELLAALSIAIDLGLGQPAEHMLRSARHRDQDRRPARAGPGAARLLLLHGADHVDRVSRRLPRVRPLVRRRHRCAPRLLSGRLVGAAVSAIPVSNTARGQPLLQRLSLMATLFVGRARPVHPAHPLALHLGGRARRPAGAERRACSRCSATPSSDTTAAACPAASRGDAIPMQMRVAQLADMVEVHHRTYGVDGAVAMARSRRGGQFDPRSSTRSPPTPRRSWPVRAAGTRGRSRCARRPTTGHAPRRGANSTRCLWRSATSST